MDGLRALLDVVLQRGLSQTFLYGSHEARHIGVALALLLVQLMRDMVIDFMLRILQAQVFEFRLHLV